MNPESDDDPVPGPTGLQLREEERAPSEVIIFNIFDDDHYRSIEGYMSFNWHDNAYFATHFWTTVPHVQLDAGGALVEIDIEGPKAAATTSLPQL